MALNSFNAAIYCGLAVSARGPCGDSDRQGANVHLASVSGEAHKRSRIFAGERKCGLSERVRIESDLRIEAQAKMGE